MAIYVISLSGSTRSYLLTLYGDETEVIEERSRSRIMQAARRNMSVGDYLLYCPDLPCHEMYGCFEVYRRNFDSPSKRLFNCAHRYCESESFFEADRIFTGIQVLAFFEALAVYGEYWNADEMGYEIGHRTVSTTEEPFEGSAVSWHGATWYTSPSGHAWVSSGNVMTHESVYARSLGVNVESRWLRFLTEVDAYHSGRFIVLTKSSLLVIPALRVFRDRIETDVGVVYPSLFSVNGREVIIYCSQGLDLGSLESHLTTQILLMRECLNRMGVDTARSSSVVTPHKMVVDLDARMVTL